MNWGKTRIGDVYEGLYDGPHATPPRSEKGAIFLGISNVTSDGHLNLDDIKYIAEQDLPKWTKRVTPQAGDIVFSYEATLNLYAMIPEGFWGCLGRRMALIRPDENKAIGKFLFYYFFSEEWRATVASNTIVGATVDRIPIAKFPDFLISLPPLETQKKIASVLSAYDDLIENNQKQIKLLEEVAQRLYKEWFVDLHFPGYEDVKVVNGVPEGWMLISLDESISYEIGGGWGEETPTAKCDKEGFVIRGTDFYGITHGDYKVPFRYHSASNLNSRMLVDGDIIFEVSGGSKTEGVARTAYITQKMLDRWNKPVMCASFCKLVRSKDSTLSLYLFNHLQYLRACGKTTEYDKKSASSIVNYRWKDFLSQECILIPSADVLAAYNSLVKPLQDSIVNCSLEIEKASIIRDTLLPKLMSGEIEV